MHNAVNDKNRIIVGCVVGRLCEISPALYNSQIIGQNFLNLISFWPIHFAESCEIQKIGDK